MLTTILKELGIADEVIQQRNLLLHKEGENLVLAQTDHNGRQFLLTAQTAQAWQTMKSQALADGIELLMMSAFRSVDRQSEIIREKLNFGIRIESILEVCAPPGYSEHHTGRAIDIASIDDPCLEIRFEQTPGFLWLQQNASQFGFSMSYPRDNPFGFQYEPWHWCFIGTNSNLN